MKGNPFHVGREEAATVMSELLCAGCNKHLGWKHDPAPERRAFCDSCHETAMALLEALNL